MKNETLDFDEERDKRNNFLKEIKLSLEQEYNAPQKPKFVEQVGRKLVKEKFQRCIKKFQANSNMTFKEVIQYLLDRVNEGRGINANSKGEYDVLEEVLYDMLDLEEEVDL